MANVKHPRSSIMKRPFPTWICSKCGRKNAEYWGGKAQTNCPRCNEPKLLKSLPDRINKFVERKALRFGSLEEARQYGIKGLPEDKPKQQQKAPTMPPIPKTPNSKPAKKPSFGKPTKENKVTLGTIAGEVGRQLTPRGPYSSPQDIAFDVKEAERAGSAVKRFLNPKKPKVGE